MKPLLRALGQTLHLELMLTKGKLPDRIAPLNTPQRRPAVLALHLSHIIVLWGSPCMNPVPAMYIARLHLFLLYCISCAMH